MTSSTVSARSAACQAYSGNRLVTIVSGGRHGVVTARTEGQRVSSLPRFAAVAAPGRASARSWEPRRQGWVLRRSDCDRATMRMAGSRRSGTNKRRGVAEYKLRSAVSRNGLWGWHLLGVDGQLAEFARQKSHPPLVLPRDDELPAHAWAADGSCRPRRGPGDAAGSHDRFVPSRHRARARGSTAIRRGGRLSWRARLPAV